MATLNDKHLLTSCDNCHHNGHLLHVTVSNERCDTNLKLVGLPSADYLRHEEIGVEKVHVLIQESMEDQQTVGSEDTKTGQDSISGTQQLQH